jgi:hypothetical protein
MFNDIQSIALLILMLQETQLFLYSLKNKIWEYLEN